MINLEKIIIGIVIAVLVFLGIRSFAAVSPSANQLLVPQSGITTDSADGDLLSILSNLKLITLDGSIFTEPAFNNLSDFSTEIKIQPIGRRNPFEPIGLGAVAPTQ